MWSNISAPKSQLKSAQIGQQVLSTSPTENGRAKTPPAGGSSPLMRYKHAICASQTSGLIYIHGGRFGNGLQLDDDVWRFDPHQNSWLQLKTTGARPPSLQEHTLIEHEGFLYLFGGQVSAASGQDNSFWRLDLASNEWSSLNQKSSVRHGAYLGPLNRRAHSAVLHAHSMYIFGGFEDFRGSSSQLWQYDLLNERWELRNLSSSSACHPEPRHSHSAVVFEDSMFVYGGLSNLKPLGDLWRWSWRDKRWFRERTRGHSPGPLHGHSAIQAFESMFIFGGERQNGRLTRSLWRLDLRNLCWHKIRPKGPRPNPTTWHVAVANPMHALDEANFLIEGDELVLMEERPLFANGHHPQQQQQQHHAQHQQQTTANSVSDNCFLISSSQSAHQQHQQQQQQREETHPAKQTIRPNDCGQRAISARQARCSAANSASDHQLNLQALNGAKTKMKRKLRLNFLRRGGANGPNSSGKQRVGSKRSRAMDFVRRQMPSSWSSANINTTSGQPQVPLERDSSRVKRHSVEIGQDLLLSSSISSSKKAKEQSELQLEQIEMESQEERPTNSSILDTLDTDIKQMFESTQMSPRQSQLELNLCGQIKRELLEENEENSMTPGESNFGASLRAAQRDSVTQSQLTSYASGLAAGSRPSSFTSQSYRTAREQLTSGSSELTITNQQRASVELERPLASGRLGEIKQRRSMHQFNRRAGGGQERRARPKSEIVQSLIERADARIKHFYTPLFQPEHQRAAPFNANDPILGSLQNHRMFDRLPNRASGSLFESHSGSKQRSNSFADRTKRHTIHQTTTYYNLYFGEESRKREDEEEEAELDLNGGEQQACDELTSASSATSTSTIKNISGNNNRTPASYSSTTAALVGVRDGSSESSTPRGEQRSRLGGANQDTDASVASSLLASSQHTVNSSRTICAEHSEVDDAHDPEREYVRECARYADGRQQGAASELGADNTSMSFSVIAEFEEDDMLQYSSPSDSERRRQSSLEYNDDDDDDGDEEEEDQDDRGEKNPEEGGRVGQADATRRAEMQSELAGVALLQQKSASSGYDSIQSSCTDANSPQHQQNPSSSSTNGISGQFTSTNDDNTNNYNDAHSKANRGAAQSTANMNSNKQYPSAGTADSLHTLTNSSGCSAANSGSLMHSPAGKSLALSSSPEMEHLSSRSGGQQEARSSPASKLAARLFGRRQSAKTRYWQLCMFVIGGKQQASGAQGPTGAYMSEPINIWRLYI